MTSEEQAVDFQCSHCEAKDEPFSYFQNQHEDDACRIQIENLPEGLTEEGVRNLLVTVGLPLLIEFDPVNHSAVVVLESMKHAVLAVRDLNQRHPYYLIVTILHNEVKSDFMEHRIDIKQNETDSWDFSVNEGPAEYRADDEDDDDDEKVNESSTHMGNTVSGLDYDPSIRMRQEVLDFKTESICISKGRGYMDMGKEDRFVGGLEKFVCITENWKFKDEMEFRCEICQSRTTQMCSDCHASFCSMACLSKSSIDHPESCSNVRKGEEEDAVAASLSNLDLNQKGSRTDERSPEVDLTSGCTVVMSSYRTMQTVFVRRTDEKSEDMFMRLCNDVAVEALKGGELKEAPEEGEVVLSKYYEDLCYYRARVSNKANGKISVLFIDFGNTQETDLADLKPLPESLKSVPGLAFQVHLKNVSEDSTLQSVEYYNKLTAEGITLILNYDKSTDEVVLVEKESNTEVNKTVIEKALPSWKKHNFSVRKLENIYYLESISQTKLEVGKTCNLIISHFGESEFLECNTFWVTRPDTDHFAHVNSRMRRQMREYCRLLKGHCYLPRANELCLARENGEWHRCVNLESHKTTCCLLFLDDGHSSSVETKDIRRMIEDFTEVPSQAVCCVLTGDPKLETEKGLRSKVVEYLKEVAGKRVDSVHVLKLVDTTYHLSLPRVNEIVTRFVQSFQSECATDD